MGKMGADYCPRSHEEASDEIIPRHPTSMKLNSPASLTIALLLAALAPFARADLGPRVAGKAQVESGAGFGKSQPPTITYLGVSMAELPPELAAHLPIDPGTGIVVNLVLEGSPAAAAGIEKGDILARIDERILVTPKQLQALVTKHKPGDQVEVTFIRRGEKRKVTVMLMAHERFVEAVPERRIIITPARPH